MSGDRKEGRKARRRGFRPSLDGSRLEARVVLSTGHAPFVVNQFLLTHPQPGYALALNKPPRVQGHLATTFFPEGGPVYTKGYAKVETVRGGQGVQIAMPDGSHFRVTLTLADSQYDGGLSAQTGGSGSLVIPSAAVQGVGTVRAYPMPGGKVGLIVDGTTDNQQLVIDPLPFPQRKNYAHSFAYGQTGREHILNIGSLNVTSGKLNAVLGFHSADLSGPLTIGGTGIVDRIALNSLQPGAALGVGGTLNTLDVLHDVTLTSGPGVSVGRDLNLLNVGGNITLSNGANFLVGRDVGAILQPPKGTSTGSNILVLNIPTSTNGLTITQQENAVGAFIQGNVVIGPGSTFAISRLIQQQFRVLGMINGGTRFTYGGTPEFLGPFNATQAVPVAPNIAAVASLGGVTP